MRFLAMDLWQVLQIIHLRGGITTKSDFARERATEIAELASKNMLTTDEPGGTSGNVWRLTVEGLKYVYSSNRT